ncbi:MAG: ABC transporter ATP-binding protein [Eubacterium sp.]|nr:ABC transporter ATP-binding protein [Eubacterium sp.]
MAFIEVKNYTKSINGNTVLNNINLNLEKGKIYGLVGKNGSGKTMLIRAMCGLITSNTGEIYVDGQRVGNGIYPKSLGVVIENISMFDYMSAFKNLKMLNDISFNKIDESEIKAWLERFHLKADDNRNMKKYSLGMKQKVSLIQAFMNKPDLIILDEPTNALDEESVKILSNVISDANKNEGTTFIIASHDRANLDDLCDEIIEMKDGKLV